MFYVKPVIKGTESLIKHPVGTHEWKSDNIISFFILIIIAGTVYARFHSFTFNSDVHINSADPDQTLQDATPELGLHYLHKTIAGHNEKNDRACIFFKYLFSSFISLSFI